VVGVVVEVVDVFFFNNFGLLDFVVSVKSKCFLYKIQLSVKN